LQFNPLVPRFLIFLVVLVFYGIKPSRRMWFLPLSSRLRDRLLLTTINIVLKPDSTIQLLLIHGKESVDENRIEPHKVLHEVAMAVLYREAERLNFLLLFRGVRTTRHKMSLASYCERL